MAGILLEKGKRIYSEGQPMTAIHVITAGRVAVEYPGGTYELGKGDVIGICECSSELHFLGYYCLEDTTILSYPFSSFDSIDEFLTSHIDMARLLVLSLFRQITILMEQGSLYGMQCKSLSQNLLSDYSNYTALCTRYRITPRTLEGLDELAESINEDTADSWLLPYYAGLNNVYARSKEASVKLLQEPGISVGIIRKGSLDFQKTFSVLKEQFQYCSNIAGYYFHPSCNDLFDFMTSLLYRLGINNDDSDQLYLDINRIILQYEDDPSLDSKQVAARIENFQSNSSLLSSEESNLMAESDAAAGPILQDLLGSLNQILDFAGPELDIAADFREHINAYKKVSDRNSMDDNVARLRKAITQEFYSLYSVVFEKSLQEIHLPAAVKMFLYFGYVDEELAESANCVTMYKLAESMEDQSQFSVYTFYHWLRAIYDGRKQPCRNEFEEDFSDYLRKQLQSGNISAAEMAAMAENPMSKVNYELQNVFPTVNKVTCGRISTFCPVFSGENMMQNADSCIVTVSALVKALNMIRAIDYSAFYRESLDADNTDILGKETFHYEYIPDIILMPNIGMRGIMWQEIEGKKRTTPGRFFLSIFHLEDVNTTMIRLTGEFRWALCKRVQGARWNDPADRSLTSEYFDYVQFYRKNHELNAEAKERVRTSLQRSKNSFKEMFVRDYIIWVLFESNGSPRLNKVARRILFTYCPFSADSMNNLTTNPLYGDLIARHKVIVDQKLHRLDGLRKKLQNNNQTIPDSLEKEIFFIQGSPLV